ncbi:MAG: chromosome segregation protein SMC [Hyphomicrobiaceae bacterium]
MHIRKLRLLGFKSFVEPTDLTIAQGLTGVVGPNGCGKSNLLEALRWVMGESSYKSMRASAMEDVIFSGTVTRPARNTAEVTIFIDNAKRTAPVEYNDSDDIEITRRIERDAGSAYRINGREARARDVKILFEDAATGARSPALVRQGQIGEIVNAKPEQRRRILEDAAGIAGLHSRRHEAELRLKGAENNLARLGDLLGQLKSQLEGLKRQARQARRYADLSDQIRKAEAIVMHLTWLHAQADVTAEEAALQQALQNLGIATQQEAEAIRIEADLAEKMQPLREQEAIRSAVATRQRHELDKLTAEAERLDARKAELAQQAERLAQDQVRERELVGEAERQRTRLAEEHGSLEVERDAEQEREGELKAALATAQTALADIEAHNNDIHKRLSDRRGEERSLRALTGERAQRRDRLATQMAQLNAQLASAEAEQPDASACEILRATCEELADVLEGREGELLDCEATVSQTTGRQKAARDAREAALVALHSLETEHETLAKLLQTPAQEFPPVLDEIDVSSGLEAALAAALGDDIEAALNDAAPVFWSPAGAEAKEGADGDLPAGVEALLDHVDAPEALHRRLRQIGLVDPDDGARLQADLRPGQRLVSRDGHLWRWDGLIAKADAPSPAAQRLAGRNRLREIETQLNAVRQEASEAQTAADKAGTALETAQRRAQELRQQIRQEQAALAKSRDELTMLERALNEFDARMQSTRATLTTATQEHSDIVAQIAESDAALAGLDDPRALEAEAASIADKMRAARDSASELKAAFSGLERERQRTGERLRQLDEDIKGWQKRGKQSAARLTAIAADLDKLEQEQKTLAERPEELEAEREKLRGSIEVSERERTAAADAVAATETALREATTALRELAGSVAERREERARTDARLEGARLKRAGISQGIHDTLETTPEGCLEIAEIGDDDKLPSLHDAEGKLARLRTDRERLGGVNLQAERELAEIEEQHGTLDRERVDVDEAIAKLRSGIASLNREARKRLKEAFVTVDGHFQTLFKTLFDGGEARLSMIESDDDPLAGGLEIIAKPPGKKPTTLSLLSGGEQTLTALSLIFAVFLTNPSPICVLDEVDAPLDDANVDRFCRMMEKMAADTDTRFLCITHHPETMARMDRLFGVTMGEKGVSQLVSVDLQMAERFLEAGE